MIDYCQKHKLPIKASKDAPYSTDANLLGLTHEAGKLEHLTSDPWFVTPGMGVLPKDAPTSPRSVTVRFEQGRPVAINGKPVTAFEAIRQANAIGGKHGVGIATHLVENRFVGIKSRGVYEAPGMELLGTAYAYLLQLVLDRRGRELFDQLSLFVAKQIYQGYGFDLATHMARSAIAAGECAGHRHRHAEAVQGPGRVRVGGDVPHQMYSESERQHGGDRRVRPRRQRGLPAGAAGQRPGAGGERAGGAPGVGIGALLVFILYQMSLREDRSDVPLKLIEVGGLDDFGDGSAGSGGEEDPFIKADGDPVKSLLDSVPDPNKLSEIRDDIRQTIKYIDPTTGNLPISDANALAYKSLEESVRKKLLGVRQGSGDEQGTGFDGSAGKGPGGTGADSTFGRNLRWTLRFKVTSGRDYLTQLKAMGAEILVPVPGSDKCVLIKDIDNPSNQRVATDDDFRQLAQKIKFSDSRASAVRDVALALGLDFTPKQFWAFFPKHVEEELDRKEKNHRNRRAEEIEETVFTVTIRGGTYEVVVYDQKFKR
jgi:hypothetical protein